MRDHLVEPHSQPGAPSAAALLRLEHAYVRFGAVAALHDLNLVVHAGERLALIGANGSGKSTLLRLMHGLIDPSSGACWRSPHHTQAMLFQRPHMVRTSARSNVALALWLRGCPWTVAVERAEAALHRVGLGDRATRSARTLSGGQQQRLALARAWALQPHLLLLDEPTASLDPHAKREVEALMAAFAAGDEGAGASGGAMTLAFASHNLGQVKRLATRVVYMEGGRILADLPVDRFFHAPDLASASPEAHLFVKGESL